MMKNKARSLERSNELSYSQKGIMYLFLLLVGVTMLLPMWNVIVVSTTTSLEASRSGVQL